MDIDPDLHIKTNPNSTDIAGVYWKNIYIGVAIPPEEIHDEVNRAYQDAIGQPYKSIGLAIEFIEAKLPKFKKVMKEDPTLLTEKLD